MPRVRYNSAIQVPCFSRFKSEKFDIQQQQQISAAATQMNIHDL